MAWKDIKLRTFITESNSRNDLASHVYDISYESITPNEDNLVIIDDSIVRGTTLKEVSYEYSIDSTLRRLSLYQAHHKSAILIIMVLICHA